LSKLEVVDTYNQLGPVVPIITSSDPLMTVDFSLAAGVELILLDADHSTKAHKVESYIALSPDGRLQAISTGDMTSTPQNTRTSSRVFEYWQYIMFAFNRAIDVGSNISLHDALLFVYAKNLYIDPDSPVPSRSPVEPIHLR
jgi:hypothetical protein